MAKAELKNRKTKKSVKAFIDGNADDTQRKDCEAIMKIMRKGTGKACLYIKTLSDIDVAVLEESIERCVARSSRSSRS